MRHFYFLQDQTVMGKDKTKDGDAATSSKTNRDHSWDQEARDTALAKTITEAVAREMQTTAEVVTRNLKGTWKADIDRPAQQS